MTKIFILLNVVQVICAINKCGNQTDCLYSLDTIVCFDIKSNQKECFLNQFFYFYKIKKYTILTKNILNQLLKNHFSLIKDENLIFSNIYGFEVSFLSNLNIKSDKILIMAFVDSNFVLSSSRKSTECIKIKQKNFLKYKPFHLSKELNTQKYVQKYFPI